MHRHGLDVLRARALSDFGDVDDPRPPRESRSGAVGVKAVALCSLWNCSEIFMCRALFIITKRMIAKYLWFRTVEFFYSSLRESNKMPERTKLWYLKNINVLEGLPEHKLKALAARTSMSRLRKSGVIYFPETQSKNIYFLKSGHVKIVRLSPEGREAILDIVGPGEIFGELALTDEPEEEYVEIAEALDEVLICAMSKDDFTEFLKKNPDLNLRMLKLIGLKLRRVESKVEDLIFKNVRERIITFLLRFAEAFGKIKDRQITVPKFLSQDEIAHLTGASRQTVAMILNDLRQEELIDFTTKSLTILQPERLRIQN
jgi:CRP-like cAMP-binding protein